jgi:putative ABC transport system permease protein
MIAIALRSTLARRRRLVGTLLAVFLGVSFLTGTLTLSDTMRANFDSLFTDASAGTDVVVRSATELEAGGDRGPDTRARGTVPASVVDDVAAVPGVAAAVPSIEGYGQLRGADGDPVGGNGPPRRAANWVDDPALNPYRLVEGRAPSAPGEVVVNRGAADEGGISVGDRTVVETPQRVPVTIVGIATFGDADGMGRVTYVGFTLEDARRYLGVAPDRVSSVLVRAEDGEDGADLVDRVRAAVPDGLEARTGAQLAAENVDEINATFLDMVRSFLLVFAGIALLVGAVSIANTFSILVAQRTRESALLRAVGATRGQVLVAGLVETLVVAVVASVAGLAGGIALAGLLKGVFDAFGFALPAGGLTYSGTTVVVGLVVGVLVTLIAGLAPLVRGSRVLPLAALRDVEVDRAGTSLVRRVAGGVALAGGLLLLLLTSGAGGSLALPGVGAVLVTAGVVALGPVLARPVAAVLGWPAARLRGVVGVLARENAARNPRRTAGSAAALVIGVGVVSLLTVFAASLRAAVDESVERAFAGDLVVTTPSFGGGGLDPRLADVVGDLPKVAAVAGVGQGVARVGGEDVEIRAVDPPAAAQVLDLGVQDGSLGDLGDHQLAVSADEADDRGWSVGATVPVAFADGASSTFTVGAVYEETGIVGDVVLPRAAWAPHAGQALDVSAFVALAPGTGVGQGRAAVERAVAPFGSPSVEDRAGFAESSTAFVDTLLGLVYVLLGLAVVIALLGIANTLSLSIHERARELGLLRAVGQTRRQLRSMVRAEAVVVAAYGTVVGAVLGVVLGAALVAAAGAETAVLTVPAGRLVVVLVVGAAAGVLAAARPARRAARADVLAALAAT